MTDLVLILVLAAIFLFSVYWFARSRPRVEGSAEAVLQARQDLSALQGGLLPTEIVDRIFARADLDYVAAEGEIELRELFLAERKRIALLWATNLIKRIRNLRTFHLGAARLYSRVSLRTEARVAVEFFLLLSVCRVLQLTIYLRGPYAAPQMVGRVVTAAGSVCAVSEEMMSFLRPGHNALPNESARKLSAM